MTDLAALIHRRLTDHPRRTINDPALRRSAVLIPLFVDNGEPQVLFTRRTNTVEHHKGQISFPGGAADTGDSTPLVTALRETEEELGIPRDQVEVLGTLDDLPATVSGFLITPFVGLIPRPRSLRVNTAEIAEVIIVPLRIFRDPSKLRVEQRVREGQPIDVYFYRHGAYEIWGVTAHIMKGFIEAAFGTETP